MVRQKLFHIHFIIAKSSLCLCLRVSNRFFKLISCVYNTHASTTTSTSMHTRPERILTVAYVTPRSADVAAEMDAVLNRKRPRTEDDVASLESRLRLAEEARARAESELDEMKIGAAASRVRRRLKEQRACDWLA